jgi:diguanylate cyclase (GGDEF)-like protein
MSDVKSRSRTRRLAAAGARLPSRVGAWVFAIGLIVSGTAVWWLDADRMERARIITRAQISDKGAAVESALERVLSAPLALSGLVHQGRGQVPDFDRLATTLLSSYPGAIALQLAPGGVIRHVVPLAGNEITLGHNLFTNASRAKEAVLARDSGKLTLAGPFELRQGGLGAVGRLPVFLRADDDVGPINAQGAARPPFWGFTTVVFRFPDVLDAVRLPDLSERGLDYWLWRIHPDTQAIQIIASSGADVSGMAKTIDHAIEVPNGRWYLSAQPAGGWTDGRMLLLYAMGMLLFSALVSRLARQWAELRQHRAGLQALVAQRTAELAVREADLDRALTIAQLGSWLVDARTQERYPSISACRMFGLPEDTVLPREALLALIHPDDRPRVIDGWARMQQADLSELEYRLLLDGVERWFCERVESPEADITLNSSNVPTALFCTVQDITAQKEREALIWKQANFDSLTGLANRHLLHDRLEQAIVRGARAGSRTGLLFLDLDGFKWINDSLGHAEGDELLRQVAERLRGCCRQQDTVARLGGDEFTVVVEGLTHPSGMRYLSTKILEALRMPFELGGAKKVVTASIGLSVCPDDGTDVQTLLSHADLAMYQAKAKGKNQADFYAVGMQEHARARFELEMELRGAIETRQFVLQYQPIVEAVSGRLVGAEALMRWQHPLRGLVAPDAFIPLAEETGLIVPMGAWALEQSVQQCQQWTRLIPDGLVISVNVSGVQLKKAGLFDTVYNLLESAQLPAGHLQLEVTESLLMEESHVVLESLHRIRGLGVTVALDDFGTGFSSLSYLRRFPFGHLKIDKSFIDGCPHQAADARVVEGIILLAHSLGMLVVAEGVETEAQRAFLQTAGCDLLQGYLFSRPLSAAEFEVFAQRRAQGPS